MEKRIVRWVPHLLSGMCCFLLVQESAAAVYTLTIQTNGVGGVTRNPTNSVYPAGSVVTVTATPGAGWYFSQWTGGASGSANPLNVTMNSDKTIAANFQPLPTHTLSTATDGAGSVSLNPPGGSYLSNSVVTATATSAAGWIFLNWAGDASGSSNVVSVTMNGNKSITAVFVQPAAIDVSPQNVVAEVGDTVNFSVHAVGTVPLVYQWWFNNLKLAGATNTTLTLSNVQLNQEGTYLITVSNAYGSATNSATLTITNGCIGTNVVSVASEAALRDAITLGGLVRCCFNGTITLSNTIEVFRDVILDAHSRSVVISGNDAVRLFSVGSGVTFSATNVVFAHGRNVGLDGADQGDNAGQPGGPGQGGAIFIDGGAVWLNSCVLISNSVAGGRAGTNDYPYPANDIGGEGQGGAIFLRGGSLGLESVNAFNNSAIGGVGANANPAAYPTGTGGNGMGGVVYATNGTAWVLGCNFSSNVCTALAGGNGAAASGGALFLRSGSVTLSNSTLMANMAAGSNSPASASFQLKPSSGYGGALGIASGQATVVRCQMSSNVAAGGNAFRYSGTGEAQGGAVYSSGTISARQSSFAGNQALSGNYGAVNTDGRGGALYNLGSGELDGCLFVSNNVTGGNGGNWGLVENYPGGHGQGGAIFNDSQLNMTNCTIALNFAQGGDSSDFAGVPGLGWGGGIYNSNGLFTAVNVTIARNAVAAGKLFYTNSGIAEGANIAVTNGTLALRNSILAYPGTNDNAWGTVTDAGYNMSSDGSANFNSGSSVNFTDPLLGPLADNGGPTLTMALSPDSPAVDFGTSVGAPLTDQRGFTRPAGLGFDMGAFELNASPIQRPILTINRAGNNIWLSFGAQAGVGYVLQGSTTLTTWSDLEVIGPFGADAQVNRTNSFDGVLLRTFRLVVQ